MLRGSRKRRSGQALVEYLLLLCSVMAVALIVGGLLQKRLPDLMDRIAERLLQAVLTVGRP